MPRRKMMRPRRRRAPRRAIRRPRTTGIRLIDKVYSFKHTLIDQYLKSTNTTAGALEVVSASPGSDPKPLERTFVTATPPSSGVGFANYYDFGGSVAFTLDDVSNHAAYTGLFDSYKINSVTLNVEFMANNATVNGLGLMPTMYWVVDQDNASVPVIISDVIGHVGHKKFTFTSSRTRMSISVRPKVAVNVFNVDGTNNVGFVQGTGWQDCAYPTNQYYGLKFWATNVYLPGTETSNTAFRFSWTYNVSYKGALNSF